MCFFPEVQAHAGVGLLVEGTVVCPVGTLVCGRVSGQEGVGGCGGCADMAGVAVPEQAVDVRFPELLGVKALDILIDVLVLGGVGIGHVGQVAGQVGLRPVGAEEVEVASGLIFPFLVCGGGTGPCEKHAIHVFLGFHVHHEHLAFRDVEGVFVRLVDFHLFELLVGHVLQSDGDVVFEKSVAVEAHFLDAAPHVGECPVGVAQSG